MCEHYVHFAVIFLDISAESTSSPRPNRKSDRAKLSRLVPCRLEGSVKKAGFWAQDSPRADDGLLVSSAGFSTGRRRCYLFSHTMMQDLDFTEIVDLICKEDTRYDKRAYTFVRHGLDQTVKNLKKTEPARTQQSQHVSGPELLEGMRVYALDQFGPLAKTVLESWGVHRCTDFGEIVFNLIEYRVFSKTENDRREDFADIYDFEEAFVKPFRPADKRRPGSSTKAMGTG
jgi:uncharacterized repeat protein (TIGR04138 family)